MSETKKAPCQKRKKDERGEQCFAWGCNKRFKPENPDQPFTPSDSSGSSGQRIGSLIKRKTIVSWVSIFDFRYISFSSHFVVYEFEYSLKLFRVRGVSRGANTLDKK